MEWTSIKTFQDIKLEKNNENPSEIIKITINRPEVRNAFRPQTVFELKEAFTLAREDQNIGVIILTGEGEKAFCSGGDQKIRGDKGYVGEDGVPRLNILDVQKQIRYMPKPVIAMVAGYAVGGGHVLHMLCDLTIASENAKFGQPEINLGIIPGYGATQRLPRIVGLGRAIEIMTTGEMISAETAKEIGLVNAVVPQEKLLEKAMGLARVIASKSAPVIKLILDSVYEGLDGDFERGLSIESDAIGSSFATKDAKEGIQAFIEKRKADFQDH